MISSHLLFVYRASCKLREIQPLSHLRSDITARNLSISLLICYTQTAMAVPDYSGDFAGQDLTEALFTMGLGIGES